MCEHFLTMRFYTMVALMIFNISTCLADFPLNQTCSPPKSQGGNGYCGPSFCDSINIKLPGCSFAQKKQDYPALVSGVGTKSCTQSTDPRCTSAALKALVFGRGIKAAYCNDAFLVILSDGSSGFSNYLGSIKNPPASTLSNGSMCVTRHTDPSYMVSKIPLFPTLLSTSDTTNNLNTKAFPNGAGEGDASWMGLKGVVYPMPSRGAVGVSIGGQEIYPAFNNNGYLAPQKCEVDTCNEHVGGGGGQPHLHGDPFGSWCLYSAANYSSAYAHPMQIGWAFDGPSIYGRHLLKTNLGASIALDLCGGHVHGSYGYHYHAQVLTSVSNAGVAPGKTQGVSYYASTTGPYQCLKGDISLVTNYWGRLATSYTAVTPDTTTYVCTGTTAYYTAADITLPATATGKPTSSPVGPVAVSPTSSPTAPAPTAPPTVIPSRVPTLAPSTPLTTYRVSQAIFGVTVSTPSEVEAFKTLFQLSMASLLNLQSNAVIVDSVTAIVNNRRLMDNMYHQRPFLQAVTGVTVGYSVAATDTSSAALTNSISLKASALSSILVAKGYTGASVQAPVVLASAPTSSPISSGTTATRSDIYLTAGVIILTISALLY